MLPSSFPLDKTKVHLMTPRVNKLDLTSLHDLDDVLELMYYGWLAMTREADVRLARRGLSRPHHRILFVIARRDGLSVRELTEALGISKQALHGPLKALLDGGMVVARRSLLEHRQKSLHLTAKGRRVEADASQAEHDAMGRAFGKAGKGAREAWCAVMRALADDE